MTYFKRLISLVMLMAASACTRAALTTVNLPTYFDSGHSVQQDIAFGPEPWQKLDIYQPADSDGQNHKVIVFFYGGRWEFGSKSDYRFVGSAFADKGYTVVIPDYRKYPAVKFPVFVEDGAKAVAWVDAHIADYGGDRKQIYIAGHSAGAHIGALIAADPHYLKAEGKNRADIAGFIGMAGPYDFIPDAPDLIDMFGPPSQYPKMQATTFIDGHQPPMLLLYGDADKDVNSYNLDRLVAKIHAKGGCVQTVIYPGISHTGLVGAISSLGPSADVVGDTVRFIEQDKCKS